MDKAISKAIEGGYKYRWYLPNNADDSLRQLQFLEQEKILLDPLFWQALGKALGWKRFYCVSCNKTFNKVGTIKCDDCSKIGHHYSWQAYWHRFIDHIAEGKDIDSFFNELLK